MSNKSLMFFCLAAALLTSVACTPVQTKEDDGPPPPQNLLGSTDELQLVTELSFDLAKKYGGDRILVVLGMDNTLLIAEQDAECPEGAMRLTQADAARQVGRMQEAGMKVIVLTSRGPECRTQTLQELSRNGFGFRASAWPPQNGYPEPFLPEGGGRPVIYEEGVFFTAGQDKGLMLTTLLEKAGDSVPTVIVMVDHNQDDLNEVMRVFSWTGTKVHAWRYTH